MRSPADVGGRPRSTSPAPPDAVTRLAVDFPDCIAREYPEEFALAWDAVERCLGAIRGVDLSPLAIHSPGLRGYDWTSYLRCSVARMVRALAAVRRRVPAGARVLDCGSYFGNFSLMLRSAGYRVDAADAYGGYGAVFEPVVQCLEVAGVAVQDVPDVALLAAGDYRAVLAMGVIEHVPHTPRVLLNALDRLLEPEGVLVLDTPNLAYLYTRERLADGNSIFCPIHLQFDTAIPFEGHHREYTIAEVEWMLGAVGHTDIEVSTFNYSYYGLTELAGTDLERYRRMVDDPTLREVILAVSRKTTR